MPDQICVECALESCITCENPSEELACCCGGSFFQLAKAQSVNLPDGGILPSNPDRLKQPSAMHALQEILEKSPGVGRPRLSDDELSNHVKGGRLRAEREFPIEPNTKCQWAGLSNAGGGVNPIVGCMGSLAKARHHGPDKSTLNNSPENVHLLCPVCHNRWHTLNDRYYDEVRPDDGLAYVPLEPYVPHDPTSKSTPEMQFENEIWWTTKANKRLTPLPPNRLPLDKPIEPAILEVQV